MLTRARLQASPTADDLRDALNAHLHHASDRRDRRPVVGGGRAAVGLAPFVGAEEAYERSVEEAERW
jgi:hypothetical protein